MCLKRLSAESTISTVRSVAYGQVTAGLVSNAFRLIGRYRPVLGRKGEGVHRLVSSAFRLNRQYQLPFGRPYKVLVPAKSQKPFGRIDDIGQFYDESGPLWNGWSQMPFGRIDDCHNAVNVKWSWESQMPFG